MSGHSKWANTKHRKALQDAKKNKLFTKIIKKIVHCCAENGSNPDNNSKLRLIIETALLKNIPKETINKAINRGKILYNNLITSSITNNLYYELYGPFNIFFIIETITKIHQSKTLESNLVNDIKKLKLTIATKNSLIYNFKHILKLTYINHQIILEHDILNIALQNNVEDFIVISKNKIIFFIDKKNELNFHLQLIKVGFSLIDKSNYLLPLTRINLLNNQFKLLIYIIKELNKLDIVQNIYHNAKLIKLYK